MKLASTAALAAALALASIALASSASATICSGAGTGEGCFTAAHGKHWTGKYHATTTKVAFTITDAGGATIRTGECESTIEGSITNATTNAGNVTALTFTNCKFTNCVNPLLVTPSGAGPAFPWAATVTPSGKNDTNGTFQITNPNAKFTGMCNFANITCEYAESTTTAEIKGGAPATLVLANVTLKRSVGVPAQCGEKVHMSGTYTFKAPTSLYIE
jgi:hypothetical protein